MCLYRCCQTASPSWPLTRPCSRRLTRLRCRTSSRSRASNMATRRSSDRLSSDELIMRFWYSYGMPVIMRALPTFTSFLSHLPLIAAWNWHKRTIQTELSDLDRQEWGCRSFRWSSHRSRRSKLPSRWFSAIYISSAAANQYGRGTMGAYTCAAGRGGATPNSKYCEPRFRTGRIHAA